jgi:hypothetical protein
MAENPEDLNLPNSVVNRIVRDALPANCKGLDSPNYSKKNLKFVLYYSEVLTRQKAGKCALRKKFKKN